MNQNNPETELTTIHSDIPDVFDILTSDEIIPQTPKLSDYLNIPMIIEDGSIKDTQYGDGVEISAVLVHSDEPIILWSVALAPVNLIKKLQEKNAFPVRCQFMLNPDGRSIKVTSA